MKHKILSAVFGMLILSTPALAVMGAGDGEIGVGYGSTDIDSSIGIDSAAHYTLRGGYLFNDQLEIEGQFASANEDTSIFGIGTIDTTMNLYMVNGLYNFHPRQDITPYILVGIGMADMEFDVLGLSASDNSVAYQVGGGSRFFFGQEKRMVS